MSAECHPGWETENSERFGTEWFKPKNALGFKTYDQWSTKLGIDPVVSFQSRDKKLH